MKCLLEQGYLRAELPLLIKCKKKFKNTIDTNPGIIDEALKNIFMGPARDLINPKMLEEIQNVKPTTTDQGTVKMKAMETEVSPEDQGMFIASPEQRAFLFGTRDTPSGTVLAPDAADIETQRKEAAPKPLVTPMPTGQQDQTLSTPTPGQIKQRQKHFQHKNRNNRILAHQFLKLWILLF
jgi:hypothetical protein